MADLSQIREHMEVIGADGVHVGTVDKLEGDRIKLTKKDSGSHSDHHHYISRGLIATIEGDKIRLSANGNAAVLLEEEQGGEAISDKGLWNWNKIERAAAATARTAKEVGSGVGNVAVSTGRAIKKEVGDIDVDVDVRRKRTEEAGNEAAAR